MHTALVWIITAILESWLVSTQASALHSGANHALINHTLINHALSVPVPLPTAPMTMQIGCAAAGVQQLDTIQDAQAYIGTPHSVGSHSYDQLYATSSQLRGQTRQ